MSERWECYGPGSWGRGNIRIERGWGSYECKGPHPMRNGGFCPGGVDHEDKKYWHVMRFDGTAFEIGENFPTLREAKRSVS